MPFGVGAPPHSSNGSSDASYCRCIVLRPLLRLALDERSHVGLGLGALEDHQIAFPFAERLAGSEVIGALVDRAIWREDKVARSAGMMGASFLASVRQVTCKELGLAISPIDVGIDRFMTDQDRLALEPKPTRNLLWGPSSLQLSNYRISDPQGGPACIFSHAFGSPSSARRHHSSHSAVEAQYRETVALDIAIDRRTVTTNL